jgi:hypothetical protein
VIDRNDHVTGKNQYSPEAVMPQFEKLDFVERYEWYSTNVQNTRFASSVLFDEPGGLTRLGECYRDA